MRSPLIFVAGVLAVALALFVLTRIQGQHSDWPLAVAIGVGVMLGIGFNERRQRRRR